MSAAYSNPKEYLPPNPNLAPLAITNQPEAGKKVYRWNRENYSRLRRRIDIWTFALILLFKLWRNGKKWTYANGYTDEKRSYRRRIQAA